ncbi:hypothetical protein Y032_0004g2108 [Ancylostoma ceylanicum]|uniref:Uncharacterized protein n=1 Tax=Ancylostoma ceylanicum TaxID=53326 RepID=A0A016VX45_9BILA|nr:hypothetical protein Y032_0004g2108 [Ancylostoma ceylanicum]
MTFGSVIYAVFNADLESVAQISRGVPYVLITLLTIAPVLVHSLKCYEGVGGQVLNIVEKGDDKNEKFMCRYEPMNPCHFNEPDQYGTYKFNTLYANKCWVLDRAVCFCTKDKCNGNYTLLKVYWQHTHYTNQTMFDCVREYIQMMIDYQPIYEKGSKAYSRKDISDEKPSEEGSGSGDGPEGSGTPGGGSPSFETSRATGTGGGSTSVGEDGAHTSTDPYAAANVAPQSGSNPAGGKGVSDRDGYNWLLFTILAVIAGILVFIVIPILLIMIVAKYSKAKSASKGKAGKQGHGKSKRGTSKSKGPRSKSSKGTKSQSKSMQSKSI